MTAAKHAVTTMAPGRFRLPYPPEREPNDMTSAEHPSETGIACDTAWGPSSPRWTPKLAR